MSRHRKELRGALGHGLFGLCVNPSLTAGLSSVLSFDLHELKLLNTKFSSPNERFWLRHWSILTCVKLNLVTNNVVDKYRINNQIFKK